MKIALSCGHTFLVNLIKASGVVLDFGVNNGWFSQWIAQHTQARIYGYEADPRLFIRLPAVDNATFLNVAVAADDGTLPFFLGDSMCSSCVYAQVAGKDGQISIPANCIETIMRRHGIQDIDLIKMDIEGAELPILKKLPAEIASHIKQVTVEFHEFINPADLPRMERTKQRENRSD